MEEIQLFCNFNRTPAVAKGKLNAPGERVVIELLFKKISTYCAIGKLKAHEGIVVILLEFNRIFACLVTKG